MRVRPPETTVITQPGESSADVRPAAEPSATLPPATRITTNPRLELTPPAAGGFLRGRTPHVIAHRGGALEAPENTLAAFRHALRTGAAWSELDVVLSRDGRAMVIHDDTVDRTTNGRGRVESLSFDQLRALDAGNGEKVPTLDETLAIPGARFLVELKRSSRPDALAEQTVRAIQNAGMQGRVLVGSFEPELLRKVHALDPSIPLLGFAGDEQRLAELRDLPLSVLGVSGNVVDAALQTRRPGQAVWVWTIQNTAEARALTDRGVDGIITDGPSAMIPALQSE